MERSSAAVAALLFVVFASVNLGVYPSKPLFAAVSQVERTDDELLILEVHVNDILRNKGMVGYMLEPSDLTRTLLPLSAFSRAVSFSIKASPADGIAEGWYRDKKNSFHLDLERKKAIVSGQEIEIPDGGAEAHFEDIYVQASLLEKWFDMTIRPDIGMLRLYIESKEKLPFEEDADRQKKYETLGGANSPETATIPYNPKNFVPYGLWSNPSFVLQETLNVSKSRSQNSLNNSFSVQSSSDVLYFGSKLTLSGSFGTDTSPQFDHAQLTFRKSDPEKNLLWFLHAGKIEVGDITFSDVPLAVGSMQGRGISISSQSDYNFAQTFDAEKYDLEGDAPIGWDAELYRNGYFINYQQVGDDGRYHFEDVDLVRGNNLFQVNLYGADGQKQVRRHTVVRGADMLREGELRYDFSMGQPEADFLPIAANSRTSSEMGAGGHVSYGVKEYLTLGASAFTGQDIRDIQLGDQEEDNAENEFANRQISGALSATAAIKTVKVQVQAMKANQNRGAYAADASTQIFGTNVNAGVKSYYGYQSEDKDLQRQANVSVNRNFGAFSTNVVVEKNAYQEKQDETTISAGITTSLLGVQVNNQIDYVQSANQAQEKFTGELALMKNFKSWRTHANVFYDLESQAAKKVRSVNVSASRSFQNDSSIRVNGDYNLNSRVASTDIRYTRQYEKFSLDVNVGANNAQSYFGGVTLRSGLLADADGRYKVVSAKKGGLGAVGLRAFMDENENGKFDEGEKALPNLRFRSNQGLIEDKTNENGYVLLNGLSESPTRFSIDPESMSSIYMRPAQDNLDIIPRSGTVITMDMPFKQLGEIDGFLYAGLEDQPMAGMEIILINAKDGKEFDSISSEQDGYFVFSAIPMGHYRLEVVPLWGNSENVVIAEIHVDIKNPMSIDHKIILPPEALEGLEKKFVAEDKGAVVESVQDAEMENSVENVVDDAPARVVTDGTDISTGEVLRGYYIHVGSENNIDAAEQERKRLWALYAQSLGDIPLYIYKINVSGKEYFRIVGAVDDQAQGKKLCDKLTSAQSAGGCVLMTL